MSLKEKLVQSLNRLQLNFEEGDEVILNDYGKLLQGKVEEAGVDLKTNGTFSFDLTYWIRIEGKKDLQYAREENLRKYDPKKLEQFTELQAEHLVLQEQLKDIKQKIELKMHFDWR
jgi:hypothetical protein